MELIRRADGMTEKALLEVKIAEYRNSLSSAYNELSGLEKAESIKQRLVTNHEWTSSGAETLIQMANKYGAFMLRNALALAIVMGKEDGDCGL